MQVSILLQATEASLDTTVLEFLGRTRALVASDPAPLSNTRGTVDATALALQRYNMYGQDTGRVAAAVAGHLAHPNSPAARSGASLPQTAVPRGGRDSMSMRGGSTGLVGGVRMDQGQGSIGLTGLASPQGTRPLSPRHQTSSSITATTHAASRGGGLSGMGSELGNGAPVELTAWEHPGPRPGTSHTTYSFSPTKPSNSHTSRRESQPGSLHLGRSTSAAALSAAMRATRTSTTDGGITERRVGSTSAEAQAAAREFVDAVKREAAAEATASRRQATHADAVGGGDGVALVGGGNTATKPPLKFFRTEYDADQYGSPQHVATTFLRRQDNRD
jgi:hypothetical protein